MATNNLYSDNSAAIEAVLAYIRRAHRLSADDGDEFSSWARLRLLEDDCAVLAKFQGLSTFKTFLTTVMHRLFLDWRNQQWGKWRPSAEARRLGPVAVELERLILRDKIEFEQAAQLLVSKTTAQSIAECDGIWSRLKHYGGREFVDPDNLDRMAAAPAQDPIDSEDRRRIVAKVLAALRTALEQLPPGDSLIFKLRYWDRVTVARIAQMQGVEQKPLYRRFEQLLHQMKAAILGQGVTEAEMRRAFEGFGSDWDNLGNEGGK